MPRRLMPLALAAALLVHGISTTAARAEAPAAVPFEEVVLPRAESPSYTLAYGSIVAGVGLIGASFLVSDRANARYDEYLRATDPLRIETLYDETVHLDRLSTASLIAGELLVATGLYLRFVRRPRTTRVSLDLQPSRCALSYRF